MKTKATKLLKAKVSKNKSTQLEHYT